MARLDELGPSDAADALLPCCASRRWVAQVAAGRPYGSLSRLVDGSDAALAALEWPDIEQALAAHPRIGERERPAARAAPPRQEGPAKQGSPAKQASPGEREASWSAGEQRGTATLDAAQRDELRAANLAYEQRFGHGFLICATGKSAGQMLAALRKRLTNEDAVEREVVRAELRDIVALRLEKAFR